MVAGMLQVMQTSTVKTGPKPVADSESQKVLCLWHNEREFACCCQGGEVYISAFLPH
jgi:hypothetical protein